MRSLLEQAKNSLSMHSPTPPVPPPPPQPDNMQSTLKKINLVRFQHCDGDHHFDRGYLFDSGDLCDKWLRRFERQARFAEEMSYRTPPHVLQPVVVSMVLASLLAMVRWQLSA
ncbi:hypothetical protein NCLIV_037680 [Neospora caninum Liverpool]|uniref:Uncharacterized protein n=1 Tax=Neospora caninum (strain Liverpool) TaxID=572307 RepID=F0VJS5_NEOCL|nr:hypothetical protein NCLIV_037680 [Neospora caninum Liverpool]CBZ53986.1 hypothetical protein NCLIV_037680 [Neospora caninum Liverpool]CEL67988.1 TPA: hypothetical protein BN1204_037680 [Neospora caninum Liverpool]|eukprot:XP_003884018.1 hypothetical protein NCLIV_037680 [Neospora caninum Liverpool]